MCLVYARLTQLEACLPYLANYSVGIKMKNTKQVGNLTELQCATRLYELGCAVSIPFGNSEKYDLIIDVNGKLYKVQCKHSSEYYDTTGELEYIKFKTTWQSHNANSWAQFKYTENEVDFFATFYNGECYLIPQNECSTEKRLRIKPPKNGQTKGVAFLKDYKAKERIKAL